MDAPTDTRSGPIAALLSSPAGAIGALVLGVLIVACLGSLPWTLGTVSDGGAPVPRYDAGDTREARISPFWWPPSEDERERLEALPGEPPTFLLGSDRLGRSVFIRALTGGGISLGIGIAAATISVVIGTLYGSIAGFSGGRVDAVMMRIVDVLYGLPYVLLVVLIAVASEAVIDEYTARTGERTAWIERELEERPAADRAQIETAAFEAVPPRRLSPGVRAGLDVAALLVAIGGVSWLTMARVVRGEVLSLRTRPFVEAARIAGAGPPWIFTRHLLPNLLAPILVYGTLTVPQAILQESFLSFLGIGVKPPLPSWGNMAADGLSELNTYRSHWWLLAVPSVLLAVTLLALNFLGEGLREAVDPRRRSR